MSIVKMLLGSTAVFGSLIVFPEFVPWMVGAWLVGCAVLIAINPEAGVDRRTAGCLIFCAVVLIVKQPGWTPSLIGLLIGCGFQSLILYRGARFSLKVGGLLILFCLFGWMVAARKLDTNASLQLAVHPNRTVVCLGDSLTDFGYPNQLQLLITSPIADFGQNGLTAEKAIEKLPMIIAQDPLVVIVELGGHDYKDGKTRVQTRAWLVEIITTLESAGVPVILVEIPRGFISDPYAGLERELSREFDLQLVPDTMIRRIVYWSPIIPPGAWANEKSLLSEDGLHPNANGNRLFASYTLEALVRLFGEEIRR